MFKGIFLFFTSKRNQLRNLNLQWDCFLIGKKKSQFNYGEKQLIRKLKEKSRKEND